MSRRSLLIAGLLVVVALWGVFAAAARSHTPRAVPAWSAESLLVQAATAQPVLVIGDSTAPVTIELFSDFQCPFCAALERGTAAAVERAVRTEPRARLVYYDLALPGHAFARHAALAARCAATQGRFAEARHALFATQARWTSAGDSAIDAIVRATTPDTAAYDHCLATQAAATKRLLDGNLALAISHGVAGTPTYLIRSRADTVLLEGVVSATDVKATLARVLAGTPVASPTP